MCAKREIVLKCLIVALLLAVSGCSKQRGALHFAAGLDALKTSNYEKAIDELGKAGRLMPKDAAVFCNLGIAYWQKGMLGESIGAFKQAHDIDSLDPVSLEYMGLIFLEMGNIVEARKALADALKIFPDSPRILNALAAVEYKAGNINQAYAGFSKATDNDPKFAPAYYNLGRLYLDKIKNTELANRNFNRFIQYAGNDPLAARARLRMSGPSVTNAVQNPASVSTNVAVLDVDVLIKKAMSCVLDEDYDDALVLLKECESRNKDKPDIYWGQAVIYDRHVPSREKAIERYRQFIMRFPQDQRCKVALDRLKVLDIGPIVSQEVQNSAQRWFDQGISAHGKADVSRAIACYKEAVRLNPSLAGAWFNLGLVYYEADSHSADARKAFEKVISIQPDMAKASYMLAMMVKADQGNKAALEILKETIKKNPNYGKAYYMMGVVYREDGRPDLARECFNKFITLAPKDPQAETVRSWLGTNKGTVRLPR